MRREIIEWLNEDMPTAAEIAEPLKLILADGGWKDLIAWVAIFGALAIVYFNLWLVM